MRSDKEVIARLLGQKYRMPMQSERDGWIKMARRLSTNSREEELYLQIYEDKWMLPAGRIIAAYSTDRDVTAMNCFVSETIEDSFTGIMRAVERSGETLRRSGGIGHNYSTLRPRGTNINSFDTPASGPVSFIRIWDSMSATIASAGNRRGAMMTILNVDHPDIEEFIQAKAVNPNPFPQSNFSVGITDEFMRAVQRGDDWHLRWDGKVYKTVKAKYLWKLMMDCAYDWGDPGVFFLSTVNRMNNLWYCEDIQASNPCGEQPLPPNGACLLGSINLTQMLDLENRVWDISKLETTVRASVRMLNRVIDTSKYPLVEQKDEMENKRRMGIGVMGLANAVEYMGYPYGSRYFIDQTKRALYEIMRFAYDESIEMAKEDGCFPAFNERLYLQSNFISNNLPVDLIEKIHKYGIRNSHLTSIAPTGSIALLAGNISSGIEPVFEEVMQRKILFENATEPETCILTDYGVKYLNVKPVTANNVPLYHHILVQANCQDFIDSAVSKTINCAEDTPRQDFETIYRDAWRLGAKGCTVFRDKCKRTGILAKAEAPADEGPSCEIDENGRISCG